MSSDGQSSLNDLYYAPEAKPPGFEDAFGEYGPQFYDGDVPVLWGFKLLYQVGEGRFSALKAFGNWYYKRTDQPPAYYLITKGLTRREAIARYGAVTAEVFGRYGGWQSTTFGSKRLSCPSVRATRQPL